MIWATLMNKANGLNHYLIRLHRRLCNPCLRYELLPMSPVWTPSRRRRVKDSNLRYPFGHSCFEENERGGRIGVCLRRSRRALRLDRSRLGGFDYADDLGGYKNAVALAARGFFHDSFTDKFVDVQLGRA